MRKKQINRLLTLLLLYIGIVIASYTAYTAESAALKMLFAITALTLYITIFLLPYFRRKTHNRKYALSAYAKELL